MPYRVLYTDGRIEVIDAEDASPEDGGTVVFCNGAGKVISIRAGMSKVDFFEHMEEVNPPHGIIDSSGNPAPVPPSE
jgi:hypothetical protein